MIKFSGLLIDAQDPGNPRNRLPLYYNNISFSLQFNQRKWPPMRIILLSYSTLMTVYRSCAASLQRQRIRGKDRRF